MVRADMVSTNYQDLLRIVGYFVDEHGLSNIRLAETDGGFVLQGTARGNGNGQKSQKEVCFLTTRQISDMMLWA
jgi:hypothetical protein